MDLATRLKTTRKKLGLSQSALAAAVGVSQPTVANWEGGGHIPRRRALEKIAEALGKDAGWLLGGELPANLNPAYRHLALPINHIPVFDWPSDDGDPTAQQPVRFITFAIDTAGVFALLAEPSGEFPMGAVLIFSRLATDVPARFLVRSGKGYALESRSSVEDVFARLIYSVVPH